MYARKRCRLMVAFLSEMRITIEPLRDAPMRTLGGEPMSVSDNAPLYAEYVQCVRDLTDTEIVRSMKDYIQHGTCTVFAHSVYVSYLSFTICKKKGLDYKSAARGALLHDFFLYDWHTNDPNRGLHGIAHPGIALKNATAHFDLNELEREIIGKHMWPLTIIPPKHRESFIVLAVDKYCALKETFRCKEPDDVRRVQALLAAI